MSLDVFSDWLTQAADIERGTPTSSDTGEEVMAFSTIASAVPCQYQVSQGAMARLSYGDRPSEFGTVFFDAGLDVRVGDKCVIAGIRYLVESVDAPRMAGVDHLEVQVSRVPV